MAGATVPMMLVLLGLELQKAQWTRNLRGLTSGHVRTSSGGTRCRTVPDLVDGNHRRRQTGQRAGGVHAQRGHEHRFGG